MRLISDAWSWAQERSALLGRVALATVVVGAAVIRISTLTAGLPYMRYEDEVFVLDPAARQIAGSTWDPGIYWYPSFVISVTGALAKVLSFLGADGLTSGAEATVASPFVEVVEPPALILAGRLVVLASSVALVWVVGLLGTRLGGRKVGLSAAALAAVMPALVRRGSIVITDAPGAFFATLTLYVAARLCTADRVRRWSALGGVAAGLALTSKYTSGFAGVALVVVLLMRTDLALVERAKALGLAAVTAAVAMVLTMPALVLKPAKVISDIRDQYDSYASRSTATSYWEQLLDRREAGAVIVALAAVGLVFLLLERRTRPVTIGYVLFAGLTMAALLRSDFQPLRNMLQLLPFLCVATAVAVVEGVRRVGTRVGVSRSMRAVASLGAMAVLCGAVGVTGSASYVRFHRDLKDSRLDAREWLEQRVQPGDEVLVAKELGFLPRELDRIPGRVSVKRQTRGASGRGVDWVVVGYLPDRPLSWTVPLAGRSQVASFGEMYLSCPAGDRSHIPRATRECPRAETPRAWHENRVLVRIYGPVES